jgi:hypothetical protein
MGDTATVKVDAAMDSYQSKNGRISRKGAEKDAGEKMKRSCKNNILRIDTTIGSLFFYFFAFTAVSVKSENDSNL